MARIRTIKPEFWANEQVMDCSPISRLLFIGLWNFCDDCGNHPASAKTLKAEIFPGDDITSTDVQGMLDELESNGLIALYTALDKDYWHVTGWHHQKIDKPTIKHPSFNGDQSNETSRMVVESSPPEGKGKGRVKEKEKTLSGEPDVATVLDHLNRKTGRTYRPVEANLRLIAARLKESSLDDCIRVIDLKTDEWLNDPKMAQYLRPETLFGATKFAQYVGQLGGVNSSHVDPFA
jgi:uncharacterized phage protein (TIGR02220 family)